MQVADKGAIDVAVTCPACGVTDEVPVTFLSRLERVRGESKLGLKVKAGKRDHDCGQMTLQVVDSATGEVTRLSLDDRDGGL